MFKIDFYELLILAGVSIPPVPIARATFFKKLSNVYYHQMDWEQRHNFFNYVTKHNNFDLKNEDCLHFCNRFNPLNQYTVKTTNGNIDAYLHDKKYHIYENEWIDEKIICGIAHK